MDGRRGGESELTSRKNKKRSREQLKCIPPTVSVPVEELRMRREVALRVRLPVIKREPLTNTLAPLIETLPVTKDKVLIEVARR